MGYFSFFTDGYREVRRYTEHNIKEIRRATGDEDIPIHVIGGIANDMEPRETRAFVHATKSRGAFGASLYDSPITSPESWRILKGFDRKGPVPDGVLAKADKAEKKSEGKDDRSNKADDKRARKHGSKESRKKERKDERAKRRQRGNDQRGVVSLR